MNTTIEMTTTAAAVVVARAELSALVEEVHALPADRFLGRTDCVAWTVRDVVAHLAGAADEAVHPAVQARHMLTARTRLRKLPLADALTAQQIADRSRRSAAEIVAELTRLTPKVPAARARVPGLVRRRKLPDPSALPGDDLGYLLDVIYTRDVWMHRIDISRATGRALSDSGVEELVVGQIVRDLQRGWAGPPVRLVLTGRVEGEWPLGGSPDGPEVTVDTVSLCRLLSGRSDETGLESGGEVRVEVGSAPSRDRTVTDQLRLHRILF